MKSIISLYIFVLILSIHVYQCLSAGRTFSIDHTHNTFLKDGKPYRYVAGSFHYFRTPSVLWRDLLLKARAAGLNAIQTYIEWSSHEPEQGVYDFSGDNDVIAFLKIAHEVGLDVVLRAGPYMDAERDMGGLPYWLLSIDPKMNLRSSDPKFIKEVDKWFSVLLPKLVPLLHKNGGPILMVQIENEYTSYGCDAKYLNYLKDKVHKELGNDVQLYTTDNSNWKCGKMDGVLETVDFHPGNNVKEIFDALRATQKTGPMVNSEFYTGWPDYWGEPHQTKPIDQIVKTMDEMLVFNASFVIYVFHGGTSFGFRAGAYKGETYHACPTSYDFDAPLNEAGDPTPKYFAIRTVIGKHMPLPKVPLPVVKPKMATGKIHMTHINDLVDNINAKESVSSVNPLTFEQLKQRNGYILYSTKLTVQPSDPADLEIKGLADRAIIFIDGKYSGTLSRIKAVYKTAIKAKSGSKLDILVENQGRIDFGRELQESKGIGSVHLGKDVLIHWNHSKVFSNWDQVVKNVEKIYENKGKAGQLKSGIPAFFASEFTLPNDKAYPLDTFLRLDGWTKGLAFLNGFNLGRYWNIGPQITLYAPAHLFKKFPAKNSLVVLETDHSPCADANKCTVEFVKQHVINATVHSL